MYWVFQRFQGLGTGYLTADDIAGVQSIYGAGKGSVTPLPVPEPGGLVLGVLGSLAVFRIARRQSGSSRFPKKTFELSCRVEHSENMDRIGKHIVED